MKARLPVLGEPRELKPKEQKPRVLKAREKEFEARPKGAPTNSRRILENLDDLREDILTPPKSVLWAPRRAFKNGFQAATYLIQLQDQGEEKNFLLKRHYNKKREDPSLQTQPFYREGIRSSYIRVAPTFSEGITACVLSELFSRKTPAVPRTYGFWRNDKGTYITQELLEPEYLLRLKKAWGTEDPAVERRSPSRLQGKRSPSRSASREGVQNVDQGALLKEEMDKIEGFADEEFTRIKEIASLREPEEREKTLAVGIFLLTQALSEAQNYRFTHYDLHEKNIMSRPWSAAAEKPFWDGERWLLLQPVPFLPVMIDFGLSTISVVNLERNAYLPVVVESRMGSLMDREGGFDPFIDLVRLAGGLFSLPGETSDFFLRSLFPQTADPLSAYNFHPVHQMLIPERKLAFANFIRSPAQILPQLGDYLLSKGWAREYPTGPSPPVYNHAYSWAPSFAESYDAENGAFQYRKVELETSGGNRTYSVAVARLEKNPGYHFELSCCGSPLGAEAISRPGPLAAINGSFFNSKTRLPSTRSVFLGAGEEKGQLRPYSAARGEEKFAEVTAPAFWYIVFEEAGPRLCTEEEARNEGLLSSPGFSTNMPLLRGGLPLFTPEQMDETSLFDEKGTKVEAFRYRCTKTRPEYPGDSDSDSEKRETSINYSPGPRGANPTVDFEAFKHSVFYPDPAGGPATVNCDRIPPGTLFHLAQDNPRSFLAWTEDEVYFGSVAGRIENFPGASIIDLYDILAEIPALFGRSCPVTEAVNLDGGRSSEVVVTTEDGQIISSKGVVGGMALGNSLLYCPKTNPWGAEKSGVFDPEEFWQKEFRGEKKERGKRAARSPKNLQAAPSEKNSKLEMPPMKGKEKGPGKFTAKKGKGTKKGKK